MSSTEGNKSTTDSPVATAQNPLIVKVGKGRSLANRLNQHIRRAERGKIPLSEAVTLAARCDQMLDDIFETRTMVFEKVTDEKTGKEFAPEFNFVKGALNTLRLRLSEAYPTQIPARNTKAASVGAEFGV